MVVYNIELGNTELKLIPAFSPGTLATAQGFAVVVKKKNIFKNTGKEKRTCFYC